MADDITIRPMVAGDVAEAWATAWRALLTVIPPEFHGEDTTERGGIRTRHLLQTDPGGAWVAEDAGGAIVGVSLALMREGVWGYSLFGVDAGLHGRRIGTRLFEKSLAYGDGSKAGIILSTSHPAAMRRYFRSGFRLLPCVCAAGALNATRIPDGLRSRPGDPEADAATIEMASRHVRGASHLPDLAPMLASGDHLLVLDGEGFALHHDGTPHLLAATNDEAARDLLWSCYAAAVPGTTVRVDFVSAGNDWAIDVALEAGLTLSADEGPIYVRGDIGPMRPYIPSGAYL